MTKKTHTHFADGPLASLLLMGDVVASFFSDTSRGNLHLVMINPGQYTDALAQTWSSTIPATLVVVQTDATSIAKVSFYQHGRSIQRCGSGTLAAAHALRNKGLLQHIRCLNAGNERLELKHNIGQVGYLASSLRQTQCLQPSMWQGIVRQAVRDCRHVGGPTDYCLLELQNEAAVRDARPSLNRMLYLTRRALIITAASANHAREDYVIRYFAPQYGIDEDQATGSANIQAAQYWQKRLGKFQLLGRQLSQRGGEICIKRHFDKQWVSGRTETVPPSELLARGDLLAQ